MKTYNYFLTIALLLMIFSSCVNDDLESKYYTDSEYKTLSQDLNLPEQPYDYNVKLPEHILVNTFEGPVEHGEEVNHLATLGRVLFYDVELSQNRTISCASCHDQKLAFADSEPLSKGFKGELTKRNSLALSTTPSFSSAYDGGSQDRQANFSWDESHADLSSQSKAAILSEVEMGMSMSRVVARLKEIPKYEILFSKAFPFNSGFNQSIDEFNTLLAIEEFVNSISSVNSKFDEGMSQTFEPNVDFPAFSNIENEGKRIFMENCSSCHGSTFSVVEKVFGNNGLEMNYKDKGMGDVHGREFDDNFKIPFLRNIALSAPYMHDGRFATLEDVVDHYSTEIVNHPNLSHELVDDRTGQAKKMNFTDNEKSALVAFLHTLTDNDLRRDVRFSSPFKS